MVNEIKEDFCPACLIVPMAFVGAGSAVGSGSMGKSNKKMRGIMLWISIITFSISLLGYLYYCYKDK